MVICALTSSRSSSLCSSKVIAQWRCTSASRCSPRRRASSSSLSHSTPARSASVCSSNMRDSWRVTQLLCARVFSALSSAFLSSKRRVHESDISFSIWWKSICPRVFSCTRKIRSVSSLSMRRPQSALISSKSSVAFTISRRSCVISVSSAVCFWRPFSAASSYLSTARADTVWISSACSSCTFCACVSMTVRRSLLLASPARTARRFWISFLAASARRFSSVSSNSFCSTSRCSIFCCQKVRSFCCCATTPAASASASARTARSFSASDTVVRWWSVVVPSAISLRLIEFDLCSTSSCSLRIRRTLNTSRNHFA
eukprot:PhM_4_TR7837/c0_g1_i1/m.13951